MEPVSVAPAAPAQVEAPPDTISATRDAANTGSFADFEKADLAARVGKPLPTVDVDPDAVEPAKPALAPAAPVSKRQQQINDYERRIAEQTAEIARLKAPAAPAAPRSADPTPPPAPAQPVTTQAEWKRLAGLPNAPKLADFDSVEEHTAAMALFIADTRHDERTAADRQRSESESLTDVQRQRVDTFVGRLDAAKTADPDFVNTLTPEVKALKPFGALLPGEPGGPLNVLAEQIYDSPVAPQVLTHLSTHPEELARFAAMPAEIQRLPASMRVKAHMQWIVKEFGKLEGSLATSPAAPDPVPAPSTITAAPPPPPTLSRAGSTADPLKAAIAKGDFATFDAIDMAQRKAKRTHA